MKKKRTFLIIVYILISVLLISLFVGNFSNNESSDNPPNDDPLIEIFYINRTPYNFESGMTWADFIGSSYNHSCGLAIAADEYVLLSYNVYLFNSYGYKVHSTSLIIADSTYY